MEGYYRIGGSRRNGGFGISILIAFVFCTGALSAQNCAPAPPGLVGWWKGDGNAVDTVGATNGALVGNTSFAPGVVGQAFSFDGDNDSVIIGNPAALQLQNFTIEAWIKRANTNQASLDVRQDGSIFGYGYGGYDFALLDDGRLTVGQVGISGGNSTTSIKDTDWHHVAVTKGASSVKFYVDGVSEAAPPYDAGFYFTSSAQIGASLWDGQQPTASFLGSIDEVSVYNRALSDSEVGSIFNASSAGKCSPVSQPRCVQSPSGLVSWWKGDGNLTDTVGTANGTLEGNAAFSPGLVGQAFSFDGDHDGVLIGNPASLQLQNFTIEAWIKRANTNQASLDVFTDGTIFGYGTGGYVFAVLDDGRLVLGKVGFSAIDSTATIRDRNWHHVAVTKAAGTVKFYVDAIGEAGPPYDPGFEFTSGAQIGAVQWGTQVGASFLGDIDEISVYNRALSDSEVGSIFNASSAGKCLPVPQPQCVQSPSCLVSWWKGDGNGNDATGAYNSTFMNGITFTDGEVGQAFNFNGTDSQVSFGNTVGNFETNDFTIDLWIRTTATRLESLIEKYPICGNSSEWYIRIDGGRLGAEMMSDDLADDHSVLVSQGSINDGVFHHVAYVRRARNIAFYIDGVLDSSSDSAGGVTRINNATDLKVGRSVCVGIDGTSPFTGQLDEISIFTRALSGSEIQGIYAAGSTGICAPLSDPNCVKPPSGLVSWWKGDGNATDATGSNNGALGGNATFAPGLDGQAFSFDGDKDGVTVGNPASLQLQSFTIEAWIKRASTNLASLDVFQAGSVFGYGYAGYDFVVTDDGRLALGKVGISAVASTRSIKDLNWHHVAVTKAAGSVKFYVDSVGEAAPAYDPGFEFTSGAQIGSRQWESTQPSASFLGLIDEVSVYNRALSVSEIGTIYNARSAGKCAPVSQPQCVQLPSGLVSWWKGDGNGNDATGAYNSTFMNGITFTDGEVGQAFNFNGTDSQVSFGNTVGNFETNDFTIDLWIRTTATRLESLIEKYPICGNSSEWYIRIDGGRLGAEMMSDDLADDHSVLVSQGSINDGVFHHVAYVRRARNIAFYIDGVLDSSSDSAGGVTRINNATDLKVGRSVCVGIDGTSPFTGQLDEISIFTRALSGSEIQGIYEAGSAGKCAPLSDPNCVKPPSGLVSWWKGDGNATDATGSNNGALGGNATFAPGLDGQAFSFDGDKDGVTVGNPASLQLQSFTIEAWIKRASTNLASLDVFQAGSVFGYGYAGYDFVVTDDGRLALGKVGISAVASTRSIKDLNWHHVAVTKAAGSVKFYVDSVGEAAPAYDPGFEFTSGAQIGSRQWESTQPSASFLGLIDEVSVYNRALSVSEIGTIYNARSAGKCAPVS